MKKTLNIIGLILISLVLINPTIVKAASQGLKSGSNYAVVGKEFVTTIETKFQHLTGVVNFDSEILEVVKVEKVYAGNSDVYAGNEGVFSSDVKGNIISLNYARRDIEENILITFKVKKVPANGVTNIVLEQPAIQSRVTSNINIVELKDCPVCEDCTNCESQECPVCEDCTNCESQECPVCEKCTESNNNNILLYGSLGACAFLLAAVVILAFKKK